MNKLILLYFLVALFIYPQSISNQSGRNNIPVYTVNPYQKVKLPETPLVYFPARSFTFTRNNIIITDKGSNITYRGDDSSKYKEKFRIDGITKFERYEDPRDNNDVGFPVAAYTEMTFFEPGKTYEIKLSPSAYCGECRGRNYGKYYGDELFIVKVQYPTSYIKDLKPRYFYGSKDVEIDFKCLEYRDPSLYSYKVFVGGEEKANEKGSRVVLDPYLANLDYNEKDIDVYGYYDNNLIMLSPSDSAVRHTRLEADFGQKGYKPNDKWKNNPDDAITLSLSNEDNLMFKFFYIFDDGEGNLREIPPIEPTSAGGGIPTVTLNGNYSTGLEFIPINNWQTIKLNPSDFASIKPNSLVKLEFNFIDEKTKQSFSYKLFCIKK